MRRSISVVTVPLLITLQLSIGCGGPLYNGRIGEQRSEWDTQRLTEDDWESGLKHAGPHGGSYTDNDYRTGRPDSPDPNSITKHFVKFVAGIIAFGGGALAGALATKATVDGAAVGAAGTGAGVAAGAATGSRIPVIEGPGAELDANDPNEQALNPGTGVFNILGSGVITYDQLLAAGVPTHIAVDLVTWVNKLELWAAGMGYGINDFPILVTAAHDARVLITQIEDIAHSGPIVQGVDYQNLSTIRRILDKFFTWVEGEQARRNRQH